MIGHCKHPFHDSNRSNAFHTGHSEEIVANKLTTIAEPMQDMYTVVQACTVVQYNCDEIAHKIQN